MMTVHEVSRLTGVSIRALQYYDRIGLLEPSGRTEAGYRLYDGAALETLQQILLFRELEFPLKDIRAIMRDPSFSREKALDQQIGLLELRREHLESLIALARRIRETGGTVMDFSAFDTRKIDEYAERARASWGGTAEYREYERKSAGRTAEEEAGLAAGLMDIFARMGALRQGDPASAEAQALIRTLRDYITEHYYACSDRVLAGLGQMYAAGGEMTDNIDRAGGEGTAAFAAAAIRVFCGG
ncbi:MAG: MerR family transcriptional regulator [Clostridia bacterium]|nr:MerR family transcriptional regulator [Clostridia bacterium]